MARKAIVDKDAILGMLRDGETTRYIAEKYNVSRQAIDLYRRDFIKKGFLPDRRAARTRKSTEETVPQEPKPVLPARQLPTPEGPVSLDEEIDLIISAFNALKRLPLLEEELEKYRQENEKALREIEQLKEKERKRLDQESRWLLTQQNNDGNSL